jgi:hypothetical protein
MTIPYWNNAKLRHELSDAQDRIFDLMMPDDGFARKKAERYLKEKRPDLMQKINEARVGPSTLCPYIAITECDTLLAAKDAEIEAHRAAMLQALLTIKAIAEPSEAIGPPDAQVCYIMAKSVLVRIKERIPVEVRRGAITTLLEDL